jgi:CheY-like chemotaxis protein
MNPAMSDAAVLIIDDDADLRDLVRLVVEPTNVDVVEAATCIEGIAAFRANRDRVCLVLLDYFMPGIDPACCARELCSLAGSTAIVLCTAGVNPAARAAEVGLSRWLAKPFELDALEALVREAAQQHEPVGVRLKPDTTYGVGSTRRSG